MGVVNSSCVNWNPIDQNLNVLLKNFYCYQTIVLENTKQYNLPPPIKDSFAYLILKTQSFLYKKTGAVRHSQGRQKLRSSTDVARRKMDRVITPAKWTQCLIKTLPFPRVSWISSLAMDFCVTPILSCSDWESLLSFATAISSPHSDSITPICNLGTY